MARFAFVKADRFRVSAAQINGSRPFVRSGTEFGLQLFPDRWEFSPITPRCGRWCWRPTTRSWPVATGFCKRTRGTPLGDWGAGGDIGFAGAEEQDEDQKFAGQMSALRQAD